MPYAHPSCQLGASAPGDSRLISPLSGGTPCPETTLVRGTAGQSIDHTASRRSGPRRWLRAVQWLIGAGLHPKANATTRRVADDLADRMDYTTGHVRYCLDEMAARLEVSRATVKRHIGYLRELGALAWVQHGTRINIRRVMGLKGYAATATVYAAVIPAAYDHAMGHRIVGSGYSARIVIDQRARPAIPAQQTRKLVDNPPVDNPASEGLEPPSLTWVEEDGKLKVVGVVTTPRRLGSHSESPISEARSTAGRVRRLMSKRLARRPGWCVPWCPGYSRCRCGSWSSNSVRGPTKGRTPTRLPPT